MQTLMTLDILLAPRWHTPEGRQVVLWGVALSCWSMTAMTAALLQAAAAVPVQVNLVVDVAVLIAGVTMIVGGARAFERVQSRLEESARRDSTQETQLKDILASINDSKLRFQRIEDAMGQIQTGQQAMVVQVGTLQGRHNEQDARAARNEARIEGLEKIYTLGHHEVETRIERVEALLQEVREWKHSITNTAAAELLKSDVAALRAKRAGENEVVT